MKLRELLAERHTVTFDFLLRRFCAHSLLSRHNGGDHARVKESMRVKGFEATDEQITEKLSQLALLQEQGHDLDFISDEDCESLYMESLDEEIAIARIAEPLRDLSPSPPEALPNPESYLKRMYPNGDVLVNDAANGKNPVVWTTQSDWQELEWATWYLPLPVEPEAIVRAEDGNVALAPEMIASWTKATARLNTGDIADFAGAIRDGNIAVDTIIVTSKLVLDIVFRVDAADPITWKAETKKIRKFITGMGYSLTPISFAQFSRLPQEGSANLIYISDEQPLRENLNPT